MRREVKRGKQFWRSADLTPLPKTSPNPLAPFVLFSASAAHVCYNSLEPRRKVWVRSWSRFPKTWFIHPSDRLSEERLTPALGPTRFWSWRGAPV